MDPSSLKHHLTDDERREFEQKGFLILENAIPDDLVQSLIPIVDRLDAQYRAENGLTSYARVNPLDFVGMDKAFLELLDWPTTFPKVWGILGWNIQLYHSHMTVSPPLPPDERPKEIEFKWHQDSDRLNIELETDPQPRVSLKVACFLTVTQELGRANLYLAPGSHLWSTRTKADADEDAGELRYSGGTEPEGATAVRVAPGTAVMFDRRIWHSASPNVSDVARKVDSLVKSLCRSN